MKKLFFTIIAVFVGVTSFAGLKTATTGNWNPTAGSNTSFALATTTTSDSILVPSGVTVTVTGIVTCGALNIQSGGTVIYSSSSSREILVVGGAGGNFGTVTIDGSLTTGNSNTQFLQWNGPNFTFGSGATFTFGGTTSSGDGGFHYNGTSSTNFTANGKTIGPLNITGAGTVNIVGNVDFRAQGTSGNPITLAATSTLNIPTGTTLTLSANNATTAGLSIASGGKIAVNGTAIIDDKCAGSNSQSIAGAGAITFNGTSKLIHDNNGTFLLGENAAAGVVVYSSGTTCEIKGITSSTSLTVGANQSFQNFYWNCAGQTSGCNLTGTLTSVAGTLDIQNTNSQSLRFTGAASLTLNVTGDLNVSGLNGISKLDLCNGAGAPVINVAGNVNIGGNSNAATLLSSNPATLKLKGNWTDGTNGTFTSANTTIEFNAATGNQTITKTAGETFANLNVNKATSGSVVMSNNVTVSGILNLASLNLSIGANTLALSGTVSNMSGTNCLTGSASSVLSITGAGALGSLFFDQTTPGTTNKLSSFTINRTTGVTGTMTIGNTVVVSGLLTITSGVVTLSASGNTAGTITLGTSGGNTGSWGGTSSGATYINTTFFGTTSANDYVTVSTSTAATPTLTVTNTPVTYDGNPHAATATSSGGGAVSNILTGGAATQTNANVTGYTVTADIAAAANGFTNAGSGVTASNTFVIAKATPTLTVTNTPVTYDGTPQAATASASGGGTVSNILTGGAATQTNANVTGYTVTADIAASANYNAAPGATATNTFVINKATPTLTVTNTPITYDGAAHAATASASGGGAVSNILTGGAATQTNANVTGYTVTADIAASANYNAAPGATATNTFIIDKATPTLTVTNTPVTYDGTPQAATASASGGGTVSNILTGGAATQTNANVTGYTVTADIAASANYNAAPGATATNTFVINKATPVLTVTNSPVNYDGNPHAATVSVTAGAGAVSNILTGGAASQTAPGSYAVTADVAASANYTALTGGSAGNFVINPAAFTNADYRTTTALGSTNNFSDASNWEYDGGGGNYVPASAAPASTNNVDIRRSITFDVDFTVGATKTLTVSGGTADFNNKSITIQSNSTGTGSIGNSAGSIINDNNTTVERYIQANGGTRAWRLLSVPTQGSQTINAAWQEGQTGGANNGSGYGTIITAANNLSGWAAEGFDYQQQDASMLTYNMGTNTWDNVTTTNGNTAGNNPANGVLATKSGYFLYVRGNRSEAPAPIATGTTVATLRSTGPLYQGNVTTNGIGAGQFALIGNVYASPVDFTAVAKSNVDGVYYVWDPKLLLGGSLGHYQTFSATTTTAWTPLIPGGSYTTGVPNKIIQTGQAFFIHSTAGSGSITLTEASKLNTYKDVFRPEAPAGSNSQLTTNLYTTSASGDDLADVAVSVFGSNYSNAVDADDAFKLSNNGYNLGIERNGKTLSIEGRQSVNNTDTVFYNMWNMKQGQYKFSFVPNGLTTGLKGYLLDSYLGTSTPVDLSTSSSIAFTIDANTASSAANRFMLVFDNSSPVPVTYTSVKAYQKNADISVEWNVTNAVNIKSYVIEKSTDGVHFSEAATVTTNGSNAYNWIDVNAGSGDNYYRIRSTNTNGSVQYSQIVKVKIGGAPAIAIYPNPVRGGVAGLQMTNMIKGKYSVRLIDNIGQVLLRTEINHEGGSSIQTIHLGSGLAKGIYQLEVTTPGKIVYSEKAIIN